MFYICESKSNFDSKSEGEVTTDVASGSESEGEGGGGARVVCRGEAARAVMPSERFQLLFLNIENGTASLFPVVLN